MTEPKPIKVTKTMELLISRIISEKKPKIPKETKDLSGTKSSKETEDLSGTKSSKETEDLSGTKSSKETKKTQKELKKEAKALLSMCKGMVKGNKECTRKESENCNGFCKQHFNIEKERASTIELIEKLMKL